MLDLAFIRDNPDLVKKGCRDKQMDEKVVDQVLELDKKRRNFQKKVDDLRNQINTNADVIKKSVQKKQKPDQKHIDLGKKLKEKLKDIEPQLKQIAVELTQALLSVPNIPAQEVPLGKDENDNQVIRQVGTKPNFDFPAKSHHELMENLDMLDTKRAVRIAGFRSYFLKNDAVILERALLSYALDKLVKAGFSPLNPPVLVNKEAMLGTGYFPWGADDHYYTQDEQILTGTSEVALTAYHMGETLSEKDLPIKMAGVSACFRREVGTYGKDTQGIIRVHQFNKIEQVVYTIADENETQKWHEKMTQLAEDLLTDLGLSYQVLLMCSADMGPGQRKKYDLETWFPAQNKYRETNSASYFNDFQARRLGIKYQAKDGQIKHVYTLNNTMAASPRLLSAIIENYQQKDGSIKVPQVLQPLVGKEVLI